MDAGNGSNFDVGADGIVVAAGDKPQVSATADGVDVGGAVSVGASVAIAQASPTVSAYAGNGVTDDGSGSLSVGALSEPNGTNPPAAAQAFAASGSLLGAGDAVDATASDNAQVTAYTGTDVTLPSAGISVLAVNTSFQTANAEGITVGGVVAIGAAFATAESGNDSPMLTEASLGRRRQGRQQRRRHHRRGERNSTSSTRPRLPRAAAVSVAGNAAVATTSANSDVEANVGTIGDNGSNAPDADDAGTGAGMTLNAASFTVTATYTANYGSATDSTNASVAGGSGADASNSVNATTTANIGPKVSITTPGAVLISAVNNFNEVLPPNTSDSSSAAGGGVVNGSAAVSSNSVIGLCGRQSGERRYLRIRHRSLE